MKKIITVQDAITRLDDIITREHQRGNELPKSFARDAANVRSVLFAHIDEAAGNALLDGEARVMLASYGLSYHTSGKIEGVYSFDSTCNGCSFCETMRTANNPKCICTYCYDGAQEESYKGKNVRLRHALNLVIMSSFHYSTEQLKKAFPRLSVPGTLIRMNSSGDVENEVMAANYITVCNAFPAANVGFWYKNYVDVNKATDIYGKPTNASYIYSNPLIDYEAVPAAARKYADYIFCVFSPDNIDAVLATGEYNECNGKKCLACGYKCYLKTWEHDKIAEKGRGLNV